MKLLCLADLHQRVMDIADVIHQTQFTPFLHIHHLPCYCVDVPNPYDVSVVSHNGSRDIENKELFNKIEQFKAEGCKLFH